MSTIKKVFSTLNWKLLAIFFCLPFVGEFIDSVVADEAILFDDLGDIFNVGIEVAVLSCIAIYISYIQTIEREIELARRDSEEKFRLIYDTSPLGIVITDKNGKFITSNKTIRNMLGYTEEELTNMPFAKISHPGEIEKNLEYFKEMVEGKRDSYKMEKRYYKKDGSILWGYLVTSATRDPNGKYLYNFAMIEDITERKLAEEQLFDNEEKYKTLFNSASDSIFITDLKGDFLEVNDVACDLIGYSKEELASKSIKDINAPGHEGRILDMLSLVKKFGSVVIDSTYITKDKDTVPVEINGKIIDYLNNPAILAISRDISLRKESEAAVRLSDEKYKTLFNNSSDAIFIIATSDSKVLEVNDVACERLGYTKEELLTMTPKDFNSETSASYVKEKIKKILEYGQLTFEATHVTKDGRTIPVDISCKKIDFAGTPAILAVARDITERKNAEEHFERFEKLESLGLLAGGIAHDFNNLLSAILGSIELAARDSDKDSRQHEYLAEGQEAILRAKDLTQQLLTFSKGGAPIIAPESIEKIIRNSADFVLHGSNTRAKYLFEDDLNFADVDSGQISQVIQNLVINADQAMPKEGILSIAAENKEVASHEALEDGEYIKVTIKDAGIGIPEEYMKNIFDPYFSTKQKGSGLGLSIVYSIIKAHKGDIFVKSELGKGTTFTIYLPSIRRTEAEEKLKSTYDEGSGESILLLEDDMNVGRTMAEVLRELGYKPEVVFNGEQAVELYKQRMEDGTPYDVVITDLTIPGGIGGEEVNKKILEFNPNAKTIATSGYANNPVMSDYTKHGFSGVLKKPVKFDEIGLIIHNILEKK
ncbi:PAS domain S-box protein [Thermodesulfobacteriota bacterium]